MVEVMVSLGVARRVGDRMGSWVGRDGVGGCHFVRDITPRRESHKQGLPAAPHAGNARWWYITELPAETDFSTYQGRQRYSFEILLGVFASVAPVADAAVSVLFLANFSIASFDEEAAPGHLEATLALPLCHRPQTRATGCACTSSPGFWPALPSSSPLRRENCASSLQLSSGATCPCACPHDI